MSSLCQRLWQPLRKFVADSRRITTSGDWLPEVDGIRLVAIGLVLVQHIFERVIRRSNAIYPDIEGGVWERALGTGTTGVLIFFTLSGYILARILVGRLSSGRPLDLASYFMRRITRLEPPYFLVMTGMYLFLSFTGMHREHAVSFNRGAETLTGAWLVSMFYAYCPTFGTMPKLNPPAWSLEIEVQFYLLAPLVAFLLVRCRERVRLPGMIACMLVWAVTIAPLATDPHLKYTLLGFFPFFFGGFAVFEIQRLLGGAHTSLRKNLRPVCDILAIFSIAGLLTIDHWAPASARLWLKPVGTLLFVAGCLFGGFVRRLLSIPVISLAGGMCYSIYLVHLPVIELGADFTVRIGRGYPFLVFLAIQFVLLCSVVMVFSWVFFRLIERPCMNREWPKRLWLFVSGKIQKSNRDVS